MQGLPDIIITRFDVEPTKPRVGQPATITVELYNRGESAASMFWVDFYISPTTVPTSAGVLWNEVCGVTPCQGIAWKVNGLGASERITLTSAADSYAAPQSYWTESFLTGGTHDLYVYADSWSGTNPSGSVGESDEENNRAELIGVSIEGQTHLSQEGGEPTVSPREEPRP